MSSIAATADFPVPAAPSQSVSLSSWIAVLASMIGAFMAILNIQITNATVHEPAPRDWRCEWVVPGSHTTAR
jgi:hypothetical protein